MTPNPIPTTVIAKAGLAKSSCFSIAVSETPGNFSTKSSDFSPDK
jgi:hypothetical protein